MKISFGDGVQYPVQIKHFPGNIGNTSNYESMGNSYSLNKFDNAQPNDTNDSRKNLLLNQSAGFHDATQPNTNEHVISVDRQLSSEAAAVHSELTIENETNRK